MLKNAPDPEVAANSVLVSLGDPTISKSHNRHVSANQAKQMGLKILDLESNDELQSAVLTVHHACILTLAQTDVVKLVQNQNGISHVSLMEVAHR
jgi:hypothetical protein